MKATPFFALVFLLAAPARAGAAEATASSEADGHPAGDAFDQDAATFWQPGAVGESWLEVRFAGLEHLKALKISWADQPDGRYAVLASVDGEGWRAVGGALAAAADLAKIDAVGQYFRIVFPPRGDGETPRISNVVTETESASPADSVNIFIGTNNEGASYSRGNQYPGVHTPFGMNAWSVGTSNLQDHWFYDFKDQVITGIKLTHQPTVWSGDFGSFDLMPMTGGVSGDYAERASPYERANEIARPYYYKNFLTRYSISWEMVPSDRGAIFRFQYPPGQLPYLVIGGAGMPSATVRQINATTIDGRFENGGVPVFFHAVFTRPIRSMQRSGAVAAGLGFDPGSGPGDFLLEMKIATSYISTSQAADNLTVELGRHSLESLKVETKAAWERSLGKLEVSGGLAADRVTFYSALYRVFAFPKMHWEPIGQRPGSAQYQSPFNGRLHLNGKLWTGNGFWDTYRGVWPLFTILFPQQTGEMIDGFVNSYKDGGWTVRWSNPGYWECMIGTHSDVIFADAYLKGIRNFDVDAAYRASVKNALVAGGHDGKGRRFLERSAFLGYVPWTGQSPDDEVGARTIEDSVSDFGISQLARALGRDGDAAYFKNRAMAYTNLWSPSVGFFRGKDDQGVWRTVDGDFDPFAWRYEWTEGNAWHYRFAPMHDGAGLVALFGGRSRMENGLDDVLAAPTHFNPGGYGTVIHEMLEAQAAGNLGFGQFAIGNEPDHHLLHMYAYAGRPSKTQYWVRRVLRQLFESGYANGSGYPGDEDNGQTSAWFVMNALGFYSAAAGHPEYVLSSPLFASVTIHQENGRDFKIVAEHNDASHVFVETALLNGQPYEKAFLTHEVLTQGGTLRLVMSDHPTSWGERVENAPSSATPLGNDPHYVENLSHGATVTGSGENAPRESLQMLLDNDSRTKWLTFANRGAVQVTLPQANAVNCYTMTSAGDAPQRDPASWRLLASTSGKDWEILDEQHRVTWSDRLETKVFYLKNVRSYPHFRLEIFENGGAAELQLAELELRQLQR